MTPFTPSERDAWSKSMDDMYRQFTSKAAEGRKIDLKHLQDDLAGGRVFTGRVAVENKLVDRIGTLDDAIAEAKSLAGLKAEEPIDRLNLPKPKTFLRIVARRFGAGRTVQACRAAIARTRPIGKDARRRGAIQPAI